MALQKFTDEPGRESASKPINNGANSARKMVEGGTPLSESDADEADFKPLSVAEANGWRKRQPVFSIMRVLLLQAFAGVLVAVLLGICTGRLNAGISAAYGASAVWVPAALFAGGVFGARSRQGPRGTMLRFVGWELGKILLTVAMLVAAPRVLPGLEWWAMLVGMVVTLKTYGIALLRGSRFAKLTIDVKKEKAS